MGIIWNEAEEMATDTAEWRQHVAQCIHLPVYPAFAGTHCTYPQRDG